MFGDWLKDFPFGDDHKKFQKKIIKFWRDAYNNFCKIIKHDL